MHSNRGRHLVGRGFSLVELLVVMFIIGLVVAITIPALGWARADGNPAANVARTNRGTGGNGGREGKAVSPIVPVLLIGLGLDQGETFIRRTGRAVRWPYLRDLGGLL